MKRIASLSTSLRVAAKMLRSSSAIAEGAAFLSGTRAIDMPRSWSMSKMLTVSSASFSSLGEPCTVTMCDLLSA